MYMKSLKNKIHTKYIAKKRRFQIQKFYQELFLIKKVCLITKQYQTIYLATQDFLIFDEIQQRKEQKVELNHLIQMHSEKKDFKLNSAATSDLFYNRQQFIQLVNEQIQLLETSVDSQNLNEQYKFLSGFLRESSSLVIFLQQQMQTLYKLRIYQLSAVSVERNQLTPPKYDYLSNTECTFQDLFSRNEQLKSQSSFQRAFDKSVQQSDSNFYIYPKQLAEENNSQNNNKYFDYMNNITPQQYQQKYQLYNNSSFFNDKNEDLFPVNLSESFKKIKNYSDFFDNQNNKQSTNFSEYFDTKNRYRILKQQNLELDFIKVKQPTITDEAKENYVSQFGNQSQGKQIKIVKKNTCSNNNLAIFSSPQQAMAQEEKIQSKNFSFEDMDVYEEKNTDKNYNQKFLRQEIPVQEFQLLNLPGSSPKQQNGGTPYKTFKEKQLYQKPINSNQTKQIQKFNQNNSYLDYDFDIQEGSVLKNCQKLNILNNQVTNNQNEKKSFNMDNSKQINVLGTLQKNIQENGQIDSSQFKQNHYKNDISNTQERNTQNNLLGGAQNILQTNNQCNLLNNSNQKLNIQNSQISKISNNQQSNKQNQQSNLSSQQGQVSYSQQSSHLNTQQSSNEKQNSNLFQGKISQKPQRKKKERAKKILKAYYQQNSDESLSSNPIDKKKKISKTNNKLATSMRSKIQENDKIKTKLSKRDSNYGDSNLEESLFENDTSEESSNSDLYYDQESENDDNDSLKQESDKSFDEDQSFSYSDEENLDDKGFIETQQANNSSKLNLTTKSKRGHYKKYSVKLKKKLVNLLLEGEQPKDLSQKYNIPMKNLQRWKIYGAERREGGGRKIMDLNMEVILLEYCIDYTLRGRCRCPRKLIMQKARDFTKEANKFKGSKGWLDKYSTRTGLSKIMSEYKQLKISNEREIFKYVKCKSIEHIKQKIKQVNPLNIFTSQQYIKFLEGQLSVYQNFWEIELPCYKNISSQYWQYYENRNTIQLIQNNIFSDVITEYKKFNKCSKLNDLNYYFGIPSEYFLKCLCLQNCSEKSKQPNDQTIQHQNLKEQSQIVQEANSEYLKQDLIKQVKKEAVEERMQSSAVLVDDNQNFVFSPLIIRSKNVPKYNIKQSYDLKDKQTELNNLIEGQNQTDQNDQIFNKQDKQINHFSQQKYKYAQLISDDDSSIEEIFRNYENNID
ncbi:Tc5 transposase DNA-binding domain protein (macronuclear) [Tetrahymena thermophila SB210]|uniref:Tc5 transposase DNA-binding domain protein n=1 Tax=Tetrahymena thermophila (strain SB210) TaxID=312017 RepID=Q23E04_TETTS|nr:Tc5 transposase DNA-binding domain protein [Tetrahymena thermophila SB210]EAR94783.3 Tc5 transposase DNA-binding domain protein [Tetrahymena thermophila SB210]|eukprot:XP_001015028.3 Tc5 transposase DNA-binding domain protein [Tetrahymena thermophila SB210]